MGLSREELEGVPEPGAEVAGKYRVDRVIGVGGMGAVVAATHVGLGQQVAIKFLLAEMALSENSVERFMREARAAATIQSDHVVRVSDLGTLDSGTPYMVMEYLAGDDLADVVARGAVPVHLAVRYVLEASEALAEAHKMGIIHRDLKPANLFLAQRSDGSDRVKVLDFGISKIVAGTGADLTRTTALMGSPVYMAPEQMESAKNADARSDIWALGTIFYELATGQLPFLGETLPEICTRILQAEVPELSASLPATPPGLQEALNRALSKKPADRYQNLAEFADAFAPYGEEQARRSTAVIHRVLGVGLSPTADSSQQVLAHGVAAQSAAVAVATGAGTGPGLAPGLAGVTGPGLVTGAGSQPGTGSAEWSTSPPGAPGGPVPAQTYQSVDLPTGPRTEAGAAPVITAPGVAGPPAHVLAAGAATAAPVSQTMSGLTPRRGRGGIIAAIVGLGVLGGTGIALAVLLGQGEATETSTSAAVDDATETTDTAAEPAPDDSAGDETASVAAGGAAPDDSATATASAQASAAPTATSKAPVGRPGTKPRPGGKLPRPGPKTKPGLFD